MVDLKGGIMTEGKDVGRCRPVEFFIENLSEPVEI